MRIDPSKPGYLDYLSGELGLGWRIYAVGASLLLVFLFILAVLAIV